MDISDVVRVINAINQTTDIQLIDNIEVDENNGLVFSFMRGKINYICEAVVIKNKDGRLDVRKVNFSVLVKVSSYMGINEIFPMLNKLNLENEDGCTFIYLEDENKYLVTTQSRILRDSSYSKNLKKTSDGEVTSSSLFLSWKIQLLESILFLINAVVSLFEEQKKYNKDKSQGFVDEE
ncbi:hypothetical protein CDR68_08390 [Salmonella enterica]|nr:hypothetical protein [Salmonella enterica]EBY8746379.1 hypothetical protein [Salmonella enterica subsp. enterica serovar Waycross]EDL5764726.1 hypothetical protein [Salmonella enterica subsp. enterica serovar Senftenberg]EED2876365.1 hypothetical protein [Salmonella enterica subsp. enterica]HCL5253139.1 hypothetical protein [Salmonella enterica]